AEAGMAASKNYRALLKPVDMLNAVNSAFPMLAFEVGLNDFSCHDEDTWKAKWKQIRTNVFERVNVKDKGKDGDQETTKEEKEEEKKAQEAKQAREDELRKKLEAIRMNTLKARCIQNGASFKSQGEEDQGPTTADGGDTTGAAQIAQPQFAELKSFIESFVAVKAEEQDSASVEDQAAIAELQTSFQGSAEGPCDTIAYPNIQRTPILKNDAMIEKYLLISSLATAAPMKADPWADEDSGGKEKRLQDVRVLLPAGLTTVDKFTAKLYVSDKCHRPPPAPAAPGAAAVPGPAWEEVDLASIRLLMRGRVICQIGDCTGSKQFYYGGSVAIAPGVRMVVMPTDTLPWKVKVLAQRKQINVDGWESQISMTMMSLKINPDFVHWTQKKRAEHVAAKEEFDDASATRCYQLTRMPFEEELKPLIEKAKTRADDRAKKDAIREAK
ncbi:unnamed protein product, partial [Prorocentrum cordatum]